jgi:hypothetical protein
MRRQFSNVRRSRSFVPPGIGKQGFDHFLKPRPAVRQIFVCELLDAEVCHGAMPQSAAVRGLTIA